MTQVYTALVLVIVCFGTYPLIVRAAGAVGMAGPFVLIIVSLLPISIAVGFSNPSFSLALRSWLRLIVGGTVMGIGFLAFTFLLAQPRLEASRIIPLVNIATLLVAVIGGTLFFAETLTLQKVIGIVAALAAIILLRPQN